MLFWVIRCCPQVTSEGSRSPPLQAIPLSRESDEMGSPSRLHSPQRAQIKAAWFVGAAIIGQSMLNGELYISKTPPLLPRLRLQVLFHPPSAHQHHHLFRRVVWGFAIRAGDPDTTANFGPDLLLIWKQQSFGWTMDPWRQCLLEHQGFWELHRHLHSNCRGEYCSVTFGEMN